MGYKNTAILFNIYGQEGPIEGPLEIQEAPSIDITTKCIGAYLPLFQNFSVSRRGGKKEVVSLKKFTFDQIHET